MTKLYVACVSVMFMILSCFAKADTEIFIIRHGEKPAQGLGQLSCKGLNRALALPDVFIKHYGKPTEIIAPNPGVAKADKGVLFSYIRPLATVEPLAIKLEMSVDASLAFNDLPGLEARFKKTFSERKNAKLLVSWEHKIAEQVVKNFLASQGDKIVIPHWEDQDFDSIYILSQKPGEPIKFRIEKEGLEKLSDQCPSI